MAAKVNEKERDFKGCYGSVATYSELREFLDDCFHMNRVAEKNHHERFSACIWGHAGVGKTSIAKQFADTPVDWNGQRYLGYDVKDVPIAQFEEMGDLHGLPDKHIQMRKGGASKGEVVERWVPVDVMDGFKRDGWEVNYTAGVRTMYAPPDWVPLSPGPSILLLDDWNRSSVRIIKGIMQLLQNYGMVSWKLPPGCNIVLTGNPDEQDYLVTSIDAAIVTRIKSVTLREDAKEWAVWATAQGLDPRGINWVLRYPEMMCGKERTNPRTLSEFFRFLREVPVINLNPDGKDHVAQETLRRLMMQAHSVLDDETVTSLIVFFDRDLTLIVEPEQILEGDERAFDHMRKMLTLKEKRIDIVGITCDRLFAHIVQPSCKPTPTAVKNVQKFLTMPEMEPDIQHSFCMRVGRFKDGGKTQQWILGNNELKKQVMGHL